MRGRFDRDGAYMVNFFCTQPAFNYGFNHITHPEWQMSYKDERTFQARDLIVDICLHYLKIGVDGFRVDMADSLVKNDPDREATIEVWDEPLNYIDIYSRMQLERLIGEFLPTMLFVEHDAAFRERVATRCVEL